MMWHEAAHFLLSNANPLLKTTPPGSWWALIGWTLLCSLDNVRTQGENGIPPVHVSGLPTGQSIFNKACPVSMIRRLLHKALIRKAHTSIQHSFQIQWQDLWALNGQTGSKVFVHLLVSPPRVTSNGQGVNTEPGLPGIDCPTGHYPDSCGLIVRVPLKMALLFLYSFQSKQCIACLWIK